MAGNPHLWKTREAPPEPSCSEVLSLWDQGFDTAQIAQALNVRESVVYNILARLSQ